MMSSLFQNVANDWILYLMLFIRIFVFMSIIPFMSNNFVMTQVRIVLCLALSFVMCYLLEWPVISVVNAIELGVMALREALIGAMMGFGIAVVFIGLQIAGELFFQQIGVDWSGEEEDMTWSPMGLFFLLGVLTFFLMNGHHALVEMIYSSAKAFPVGQLMIEGEFLFKGISLFQVAFNVALKIAIPFLIVFGAAMVFMMISNRSKQTVETVVGLSPIRMTVGLVGLAVLMPVIMLLIIDILNNLSLII